jgi:hypothetical protein
VDLLQHRERPIVQVTSCAKVYHSVSVANLQLPRSILQSFEHVVFFDGFGVEEVGNGAGIGLRAEKFVMRANLDEHY